jgi:hypothetical protein
MIEPRPLFWQFAINSSKCFIGAIAGMSGNIVSKATYKRILLKYAFVLWPCPKTRSNNNMLSLLFGYL